jgi:hypothetical protein
MLRKVPPKPAQQQQQRENVWKHIAAGDALCFEEVYKQGEQAIAKLVMV